MSGLEVSADGLFDHAAMARIASMIKPAPSESHLNRLRNQLLPIAAYYRRVLASTPTEFSLSRRLEWLDTQVLNPLQKLIPAVGPDARRMFSLWPEEVDESLMPDFDEVTKQLEHLQLLARNVAIVVAKYKFHDLPLVHLIRYRIVASIADAVAQEFPELKPSRGTFDKETKGFNGPYPDLIRAIYQEITGEYEQLDHLIKEQVEARRA